MKVSQRRVQQVIKRYRETGREPILGEKIGRPCKPYDEYEAEIVKAAHERYRLGARMLEWMIREQYKLCISHNRIHMYLKTQGLAREDLKKQRDEESGFVTSENIACQLVISIGMNGMEPISRSV